MLLIKNILSLIQILDPQIENSKGLEMSKLKCIDYAFLLIENDLIKDFGTMQEWEKIKDDYQIDQEIDARGKLVHPCYCDSHTHIVYAQSREIEYNDRVNGLSYEEIAKRGGGILNSVDKLRNASESELFASAWDRLEQMGAYGTGAVEIKSGYGLDLESELKMLRVIARLKEKSELSIKSTFLGAHALPREFKGRQQDYVNSICQIMLPAIAAQGLADYVDVFCDQGFFSVAQTDQILGQAAKFGIRPKIHANELALSGGIQIGVEHNALSVDHLEYVEEAEIKALLNSNTMATILPGAAFFLEMPLSPAKKMIEAGLGIALASDFNPGSSPSGNMQFIQSLAYIKYHLSPEQIIHATTINTAYAMGLEKSHGSITRGKKANVFITKPIPNYQYIPYSYGDNKVELVILNGKLHRKN